MRKVIMVFILVTVVLGLTACGGVAENYDLPTQANEATQGAGETPDGNADADTDANTDTNIHQGLHTQAPPSNEIIAGTVEAIDGMKLTIDTSSVFVSSGGGESHFASGEPPEPQAEIIRLTEQTTIEVRTTAGGQITDTRAGTLDDLSIGTTVMAEGEWQDGEFAATTLVIMNF